MLADLVDLDRQLQQDRDLAEAERHHRDRAIGRKMTSPINDPEKIHYWLGEVAGDREQLPGHRAKKAGQLIGLLLIVAGLFIGWGAAIALFDYEGTHPVNIINLLVVFVFAQVLLLLFFVYATLPASLLQYLPGAQALQSLLQSFNPGRLQSLLARLLPQKYREALSMALGRGKAHRIVFGRVHKWITLTWSQQFALTFNVGALAGCLYLIVISDLAFGWSTTLDLKNVQFQRMIAALSWPWAEWLPAAVPSENLIETSRYFRFKQGVALDSSEKYRENAAVLGGWWPFIVMSLLVYGLIPRFITLLISRWRLDSALRSSLLHMPGAAQLIDRMSQALVETKALKPEVKGTLSKLRKVTSHAQGLAGGRGFVINWAGLELSKETTADLMWRELALEMVDLLHAGGNASLDQDRQVIETLKAAGGSKPVVILVKSWEPPLLEFLDFLEDLRAALGGNRPIRVIPLALDDQQQKTTPAPLDVETWRNKLDTLGDPWLELQTLAEQRS